LNNSDVSHTDWLVFPAGTGTRIGSTVSTARKVVIRARMMKETPAREQGMAE